MSRSFLRSMIMMICAVALLTTGFWLGSATNTATASEIATIAQQDTPNTPTLDIERVYHDIYNRVGPSVVSISVSRPMREVQFSVPDDFVEGTGTGFVIDTQGHIVTNHHVVEGGTRIEVNFFDGTIVRAELVGSDPDADLAVIRVKLPAEQLSPVEFADSDTLFIGQSVVALGSPFGQRWTMTTGIVSAINRTIQGLGGYQIGSAIQTDAAINPGNSGGPLLDLQGRVVGVNAQILSRSRSSSGVGFAIPSNLTQRVVQELVETGTVSYSYLGIVSRSNDVDLALIEATGLPNNTRGVVVLDVTQGGPADKAGIRSASGPVMVDGYEVPSSVDIIVAIDDQPITSFNSLISYLASNTRPGQTVDLTVLRDGQHLTLPVLLTERPRL